MDMPYRKCVYCGGARDDYDQTPNSPGYHEGVTQFGLCLNCLELLFKQYAIRFGALPHKYDNRYYHNGQARVNTTRKVLSHSARMRVFEQDRFACQHCGSQKDLCVDHIIPLSKGGACEHRNYQTLCRSCNSRKGKKMPQEAQQ